MPREGRKVLVTGGAGFIGSHVCDAFAADGWSVTALDDLSSGKEENLSTAIELVVADIRSPEAAALIRDGGFEAVSYTHLTLPTIQHWCRSRGGGGE